MTARLRILKAAFGGNLCGRTLTCPTIGHSSKDRGTSYTDCPSAPGGLLVRVHNGNGLVDDLAAKDRARQVLGEEPEFMRWRTDRIDPIAEMQRRVARRRAEEAERADTARRQRFALAIWEAARDPRSTLAEHYLRSRGLGLPDDIAGHVLRFEPRGRWEGDFAPMMVALMRDPITGQPKGVHRTALTTEGQKIGRKMLGPAGAVMLDPEEAVTAGLAIGEGIETCLAARRLGIRPAWALCSTSGITAFPVLPGIEALTLLVENDVDGASERACREAGTRWHRAGLAVDFVTPRVGKDLNDTVREGAAAWR